MKIYHYIMIAALPGLAVLGYYLGGYWNFLLPVSCFILHPFLNYCVLKTRKQKSEKKPEESAHKTSFPGILFSFIPLLLAFTIWCLWQVSHNSITVIEFSGLLISAGIVNGVIGFTVAHECIHRYNWLAKLSGNALLLQNQYMHYQWEHIYGHHVYACLPADPHTARRHESIYHFLPRSVAYTFINAWKFEQRRLNKKKERVTGWHNRILKGLILQIIVLGAVGYFFGSKGVIFYAGSSFLSILLLHTVDYLQHYGLERHIRKDGKAEKVSGHHAWATRHEIRLFNLFELDKHADHHLHPSHTYDELKPSDTSPQYPHSYSGMILLLFFPRTWFRLTDNIIHQNLKKVRS